MVCASGWQGRCGHFLALSSALIAGLALAGCRAEGVDGPVVAAQELVPVRVAEVAAADQAEMLHFAGSARARQRASLTFQVGGTLASRPLQLGQAVAAGDVLATLVPACFGLLGLAGVTGLIVILLLVLYHVQYEVLTQTTRVSAIGQT